MSDRSNKSTQIGKAWHWLVLEVAAVLVAYTFLWSVVIMPETMVIIFTGALGIGVAVWAHRRRDG